MMQPTTDKRGAFDRLQIKTKLVLLIVATSIGALIVQAAGFVAYERMRVTDQLIGDLSSLARIVANRSTAALIFNDDKVVGETLGALKVKRAIVAACVYDADGRVFARYDSGEESPFRFPPPPAGGSATLIEDGYLHLTEPVIEDGVQLGTVFIRASFAELNQLWRDYLLFAGLIAMAVSFIALLAATRWQRIVSGPIERLTHTVKTISTGKDYSLRATGESDDEVGTLVDVFNGMLDAIEERNQALIDSNRRLSDNEAQLKLANEELEERVRARTAELQALFDSASVGIVLVRDGTITHRNRRMEEMFGADDATVAELARLWHGPDGADATLARGETVRCDLEVPQPDARRMWVRLSARVIDPADPARGMVGVVEDITAERAAMDEMLRAKILAEDASRMKSEFLATMSHEIRTPMNAIIGMLYLALKADLPPGLGNYLAKAQGAAHSLLGIINDILDFSKIEAGKLEIESIEFGLDAVLEQLKDTLVLQAEQKGIEFLIRYDVTIPPVLVGDPLRLGQIMLNLCSNAVKFTEKGEVELAFRCIEASDTDLTLHFSIRDTGIGMTPELVGRLFQKFTQADQTTTRRFGGTGLGLAISKHLVELMDGRIWIEESVPGKGTTVCCTVHLKVSPEARTHRQRLVEKAGPLLGGIHVLVVDDNEVSREIVAEMLRFFHLEVSVAASGPTALSLLQAADPPFDIVLMDWRMPMMNGDEVTRRIHANPAIRHKPKVVMITAYGREDVIRASEQAGAEAFLVKPVSPSMLLDTILTSLGRGRILDERRTGGLRQGSCDLRGARLLLVEDNDINREFATELLRSMNTEVDCAVNGAEAVARVREHDYAAVLMDIHMPVMDGLEAARQIRALGEAPGGERFRDLPIIAMTALAMAHDEQRSLAAGMNDHITKPVAPDRLQAALARWLKIPQPVQPAPSAASGLDPDLRGLATIDAEQGVRRIGGDQSAYRKQLQRFRARYAGAADTLRAMIDERPLREAEEFCHALKGVSGNIGAEALFACVTAIDNRLKQDTRPTPAELAHMSELLGAVMSEIAGLEAPAVAAAPTGGMDRSEATRQVAHLLDLLESDLGAAQAVMTTLRAGVAGTAVETVIQEIAEKLDLFEIDEAIALLKCLHAELAGEP
ncbi:response regulator [Zoogloea sp.]|uniref:response regulator n=1 Tax=Zoogloea sp. TaxID=49181 RepID=UPI0035B46B25